jgi:hypothetical protein
MLAKYILAVLGLVFLALCVGRVARNQRRLDPASRTWLIVGVIFLVVAGVLWTTGL